MNGLLEKQKLDPPSVDGLVFGITVLDASRSLSSGRTRTTASSWAAAILRYQYGFRKAPYQHRLLLKGGVSTSGRFVFEYESDFQEIAPRLSATLRAFLNGLDRIRFQGFGNETVRITRG